MSDVAIVFRRTAFNKYSLPLLLGIVERACPGLPTYITDSVESVGDFLKIYGRVVVAYSFTTIQLMRTVEELAFMRGAFGGAVSFIAGGPHVTADPEGSLAAGFDSVFVGEGERTLSEFAVGLFGGADVLSRRIWIDGNPEPVCIDDYYPASLRHGLFGPMEITRGCFYACGFCQTPRLFGRRIRHRSIESVLRGIDMANKYAGERLYFLSPNAFSYQAKRAGEINYEAVESLLSAVKGRGVKDLDIAYFPSEIRPESINERTLDLLGRYCSNRKIAVGIQSGSLPVLKRTGRTSGIPVEAVALARKKGFTAHCDFIFGFPDETQEEADESIELMTMLIRKYDARIHCHFFMPLPMTPLWGSLPTGLSEKTKKALLTLRGWGKLDGWWEDQERIAFEIVDWKRRGLIKV